MKADSHAAERLSACRSTSSYMLGARYTRSNRAAPVVNSTHGILGGNSTSRQSTGAMAEDKWV